MPTILKIDGFRFFFFSNEGQEPPHVHVEKGDAYAKVWLGPVRIAQSSGLTRAEMRRMRELASQHEASFLEAWNGYFGR